MHERTLFALWHVFLLSIRQLHIVWSDRIKNIFSAILFQTQGKYISELYAVFYLILYMLYLKIAMYKWEVDWILLYASKFHLNNTLSQKLTQMS